MAGYVIMGTLAAYGLLSILGIIWGAVLPEGRGCAIVCMGYPEEGTVARYRWLKGMGLFSGPLIVVADAEELQRKWADIEICSPGELIARLEWERNRFDGTGNGDPPGCDQRRGVSEL